MIDSSFNKNVFISHSSKEAEIANKVCHYLEENNINCWIAPRDIIPGINYPEQIVKAIRECNIFVLLVSKNSNTSENISNEIELACSDTKKVIIPFKLDNVEYSDEHLYYLKRKQWIDAFINFDDSLKNLTMAINKSNTDKSHLKSETIPVVQPNADIQIARTVSNNKFQLVLRDQITEEDFKQAVALDHIVFNVEESSHFTLEKCLEWHNINPYIYYIMKDTEKNEVIAYVNLTPITEECHNRILSGNLKDVEIFEDDIISYDFPGIYYLNFTSVVIHPNYRNAGLLLRFIDVIVDTILSLTEREIFFKSMVADAWTHEGEKFCKLFGMKKIVETTHGTKIYAASLMPPDFNKSSKKFALLYEAYEKIKL